MYFVLILQLILDKLNKAFPPRFHAGNRGSPVLSLVKGLVPRKGEGTGPEQSRQGFYRLADPAQRGWGRRRNEGVNESASSSFIRACRVRRASLDESLFPHGTS